MAFELPPTYLLDTHLPEDRVLALEDEIPNLTYDITEARLVLGKVGTKQRADFELRSRGLWTKSLDDIRKEEDEERRKRRAEEEEEREARVKRRKMGGELRGREVIEIEDDESTASEAEDAAETRAAEDVSTEDEEGSPAPEKVMSSPMKREPSITPASSQSLESEDPSQEIDWGPVDIIKVVKLAWYEECAKQGTLIPMDGYIVYEGRPIPRPAGVPRPAQPKKKMPPPQDIIARARGDYPGGSGLNQFGHDKSASTSQIQITRPTHLLHQTTSEHDDPSKLPPIPEYLHTTYSCQRPTPLHSPNDAFIDLLKEIRLARILTNDEIGVRAYSSSIATIAAYPHPITSAQELVHLPGCGEKLGLLWQEYQETGRLAVVDEIKSNPEMQTLNLFYNIWGVGPKGARDFYFKKGWRDLDDIVEYGWDGLSRVQQIGVKYYDEFLDKIPRDEVEMIGQVILDAANRVAQGCQMVIVGGHRRGKKESGDVDVVVSNPDEEKTLYLITGIVAELEKEGWITHTLLLSTANSERNQTPVSYKGENGPHGTGFDTLDKALVVWQDPRWEGKEDALAENPKAKNPNVHRRVDIIISSWKTVGCAVAGWTSGTTFQRDLRRYAKAALNLKFDSSGIRSRDDGAWVDFEDGGKGKAPDMLTAEKRVFEGLKLEWREPWERCTG
jgi:DNA polymerase IV